MKINNVIILKGGKSDEIKIALQQWIKLNSDKFVDHISFDIFENDVDNYLIKADDKLNNEHFFHLVNYLKYPNISNYEIDIEGFTIVKEYDFLIKGPILVYIPDTDTDYDNVFCVNQENEVYKFDFGGNISKTSLYREYIEPEIDLANLPKIDSISIRKKRTSKLAKEKLELKKINKWFNISIYTILGLYLTSYLSINNHNLFLKINEFIPFAFVLWLSMNDKLLKINKYYVTYLIISLGIFYYGYSINNIYTFNKEHSFVHIASRSPMIFLMLQRILRTLFKLILKREPVFHIPNQSTADFFYSLILLMGTVILTFAL